MQGRIKRGGGGPGDPADREAAIRQQQSPELKPTAEPGRDGQGGQQPGGSRGGGEPKNARPAAPEAAKSRAGRIAAPKVRGVRRFQLNNWRIRTRLIALLTLPVIAAIILGGLRIQSSLSAESQLNTVANLGSIAQYATNLADQLEAERDTLAGTVTATGQRTSDDVSSAEKATTTTITHFVTLTNQLNMSALPGEGIDVRTIQNDLTYLDTYRQEDFSQGGGDILQSVADYDGLIQQLLALSSDVALTSSNQALLTSTRSLQVFSQWKDDQSVIQAVISAALASGKPLNSEDRTYAQSAMLNAQTLSTEFPALFGPSSVDLVGSWSSNTNIKTADYFATTVLNSSTGFSAYVDKGEQLPTYTDWDGQSQTQINEMTQDESQIISDLNIQVQQLQKQAQTDVILNAILIAIVLLVAVIGAALVARSMVRTLGKLQAAAEDVAERRLPELVHTLSESDPQDVDTSVTPIGINTTDEIGHVARAFDQVHAQAVRLAAEQALLRGNINAMFTNLSRRSQGLIQRQLSMISELESREADPDQLASLFKLDHLATRMRRNGENLLVLAGEDPGRRWTRPVPLVDVLRAAASEVEQYERIELASVPTAEVAGRVVNDLVHLLAELLENATSFSSPQTRVRVTGHALPDGRVLVEIHDTGIGLSPEDLAEINERLANPPVVDVSVSRRMGLFVVGRLSLRHGIRIQLRPSDSGGTTALVMLPVDVTNAAERRGGPGAPGQAPGQQRAPQGQPGLQGLQGLQGGPQRGAMPAMPQGPSRPPIGGAPAAGPGGRPSLPGQPQGPGQPGQPGQGPGQPGQGQPGQAGGQQPQQGLPPRRPKATLPQGSTALTGQLPPSGPQPSQQLPRRDQQPGLQPGQQPGQPQNPRQPGQQQGQPGQQQPGQPGQQQGQPLPVRGQQGPGQPQGQPQNPQLGQQQGRRPQSAAQPPAPSPLDEHSSWTEQPQHGSPVTRPLPLDIPDGTLQFGRPHQDDEQQARPAAAQQPLPPRPVAPQQPLPQPVVPQQPTPMPAPVQQAPAPQQHQDAADHPLTRALPPAEADAARSPIFEAMESNWFRSGRADRMRAVQVYGDPAEAAPQQSAPQQSAPQSPQAQPPRPQQPTPAPAAAPQAQQPPAQRPAPQRGTPAGATTSTPWRSSSNDEVWRRAEQVREPSAGGVMPSGLPRRVPQANLVPGAAEAVPDNGAQVSRSPEEVRGRLTNLRRGIQQGRSAGTANPPQDNGPYGTNPQER